MTGYGRGETDHDGTKFTVELNSVNRKQSDVVINLPRDLVELEPRIRQTINENISRGRTNATVSLHSGANGARKLALNTELARSYHEAMRTLQKELNAPGEITIATILQAPGVMRFPEEALSAEDTWPAVERALRAALADLIGLDTCVAIMEVLQHGLQEERFAPCPLLRELVAAGKDVGEELWRMPLNDAWDKAIDSPAARATASA